MSFSEMSSIPLQPTLEEDEEERSQDNNFDTFMKERSSVEISQMPATKYKPSATNSKSRCSRLLERHTYTIVFVGVALLAVLIPLVLVNTGYLHLYASKTDQKLENLLQFKEAISTRVAELHQVRAVPGPPGVPGLPGMPGPKGLKGEKGLGEAGQKGNIGQKGATGDHGEKGDHGSDGERGDKGDKGARGETGEPRLAGDAGGGNGPAAAGAKGEPGAKGSKGEMGSSPYSFAKTINSGQKGAKISMKLTCSSNCRNLAILLSEKSGDVDLYGETNDYPIIDTKAQRRACCQHCKSHSESFDERCSIQNLGTNEFYVVASAWSAFEVLQINIRGSNLISVTVE